MCGDRIELFAPRRRLTDMEQPWSDAEAIRRSRDAPEAFVAIYERHHAAVHNYVRRRLGVHLADDLAAETFVRAFQGRAAYRPLSDCARPWLFGIATNLINQHNRAEARGLRAWERAASEAPPAQEGQPAEIDAQLVHALRRLSRRDREALLLVAWGELTYAEVAEALSIPIGTVRSRIHHARQTLTRHGSVNLSNPGEAHA
jgi:RNA polymerase sigma factor (sigma-70 family)